MNTTSKLLQSSPVADMSKVRNDRVWIVFMIYCFLVCLEKNSPDRHGWGSMKNTYLPPPRWWVPRARTSFRIQQLVNNCLQIRRCTRAAAGAA